MLHMSKEIRSMNEYHFLILFFFGLFVRYFEQIDMNTKKLLLLLLLLQATNMFRVG